MILLSIFILATTVANLCYAVANIIMAVYGRNSVLRDHKYRAWVPRCYYSGLGSVYIQK